jgi:hypothetical protein
MTPWAEALLYAASRPRSSRRSCGRRSSAAPTCCSTATSTARSSTRASAAGSGRRGARVNLLATGGCSRTGRSCSQSSRERRSTVGSKPDRIEREDAAFHERVADGYEQLAALFPERVVVLDGSLDPDVLADRILMSFDDLPEQPEGPAPVCGRRSEGPAHAYLLHGPAGWQARRQPARSRAELLGDERRVGRPTPRPLPARGTRRDDPDRRGCGAPSRPAHAPVRGRLAGLRDLERAHAGTRTRPTRC